jgi:nucleotide-binding universal stress UspA family protein
MYGKILAAMDSSANNKQVFDTAVSLAKANNASLMLLHVLSEEEVGSPTPILPSLEYYPSLNDKSWQLYQEQRKTCAKQGLELLRSHQEQAVAAGVSAEFTQLGGSPSRAICELARNWGADLIITGRRGRSGLSELFLGSVSNYVLHHAPCSVLIVQHLVDGSTADRMNRAAATSISSAS